MRFILVLPLLLAGCGGGAERAARNDAAAADFEPPATRSPTPIPGQAHTKSLTEYVGHYPDEPVDGVNFLDRTEVATALDQAVTDAGLRRTIMRGEGPHTPVFRLADGRVASWGCEAHMCGPHNWTLIVDPASGKGEVCVHRNGRTLWHAGGPPVPRPGNCPSERPA